MKKLITPELALEKYQRYQNIVGNLWFKWTGWPIGEVERLGLKITFEKFIEKCGYELIDEVT